MDGLGFVLVWGAIPAALVTFFIATLIMRRRTAHTGELTRVESWVVSLIGAGAMMTAVLGVIGLVGGAARAFGEDPYRLTGIPYSGSPIERLEDAAAVADSGYESAWLLVSGIPSDARWMLFLEAALPTLATIAIAVAVAWLAVMLIRGRPFSRALPQAIGVAAVSVMVAGIGSQFAGAYARAFVVEYLGAQDVTAGADGDGLLLMTLNLDLAPIGWALGLALVAAAFQIGTRLQRDTERLV